jgi:hypothetical protein
VERQIQTGKLNLQFIRLIPNIIEQQPSPLTRAGCEHQPGKEGGFDRKTGKLGTKNGIVSAWMAKMLKRNKLRAVHWNCLRSKKF